MSMELSFQVPTRSRGSSLGMSSTLLDLDRDHSRPHPLGFRERDLEDAVPVGCLDAVRLDPFAELEAAAELRGAALAQHELALALPGVSVGALALGAEGGP